MNKQNLMPQAAQPVNRITTGQLPAELAELSEEVLQLHGDGGASVLTSNESCGDCMSCGDCISCNCVSGCMCCIGVCFTCHDAGGCGCLR